MPAAGRGLRPLHPWPVAAIERSPGRIMSLLVVGGTAIDIIITGAPRLPRLATA